MKYSLKYKISWRLKLLNSLLSSIRELTDRDLLTWKEVFQLFVPYFMRKIGSQRIRARAEHKRWATYDLKKLGELPEKAS